MKHLVYKWFPMLYSYIQVIRNQVMRTMSDESTYKNRILEMLQREHPNYHPLVSMAEIALEKDDENKFVHDAKLRVECHKTIVKYVESELKSVEVKGNIKSDFGLLRVTIMEDDDDNDEETPDEKSIEA